MDTPSSDAASPGGASPVDPDPTETAAAQPATRKPVRAWPGLVIVALLWAALTIPARLFPESPKGFNPLFMGLMGSYLLFAVWWMFFSRAPWRDRLLLGGGLVGGLVIGGAGAYHPTMLGIPMLFVVVPWLLTALAVAVMAARGVGWQTGRWLVAATLTLGLSLPGLARYEGINSDFQAKFLPRWELNDEERLVAQTRGDSPPPAAAAMAVTAAAPVSSDDWPGFRGANRDGNLVGAPLAADWETQPPVELWRTPVGPAWSSFCVVGDALYTQEQRGEQEQVVAYDADTGKQRWATGVEARFEESVAGPGPRATPTYHAGRLYACGGAGDVMCLNAATGGMLWRRKLTEDTTQEKPPMWGFASSPLIVAAGDGVKLALVYAGNPQRGAVTDEAVIAYNAETGEPVWKSGVGDHGYSSPHLASLGGMEQVLMWTNKGLESLALSTGERLWFYDWDIGEFPRSIQPLVVDDQTIVLSAGYDSGTMPIRVTRDGDRWQTEELWPQPSQDLVPYFNDMVLHAGHLFGIHKKFLVCIDMETGKATWPRRVKRKTKLGNGQLVLDPASGRLIVTAEDTGEVLLVEANPETFVVRGRMEALSADTNWNHPVVADGRLYVRHGSEAACYQLPQQPMASR